MKYSKTTLMELSHKYRSILRKCALFNAAILMGAMVTLPAGAATERVVVPTGETGTVSENLTNFVNLLTGGAAQNSGTLNVDDEISFEGKLLY